MSGWDTLIHTIEDIFDESGLPIGSGFRAVTGLGDNHPAAPAPPPPAPPAPPGPPPPAPPAGDPPAGPSGQAAGAGAAEAGQVGASVEQLAELDKSSAATLASIQSAGQAGRQQLDQIQADVNAKITELGPRLNTPQGQQELRECLKDKLGQAKAVLDKAAADAEEQARKTHELAQQYSGVGGSGNGSGSNGNGGKGSGGGGAGNDPPAGGNAATGPAAAPPGASAAGVPAGMMTPGMMPGGGMPFGGLPIPSFGGGGGVPGFGGGGFGDPLGGLGGGIPHGQTVGFHDDPEQGSGHKEEPKSHEPPGSGGEGQTNGSGGTGTQPAGGAGAGTNENHGPDNTGAGAGQVAHVTGTDVNLPDGSGVVHARTEAGATAVRAALGGATVADAYKEAGIELPPAGTPVTDPLPPTQLKAGDVGMWKDHLVMALGDGKVLVSGQIQSQDSLGSGPDFLGFFDPTKGKSGSPVSQPPAQSS